MALKCKPHHQIFKHNYKLNKRNNIFKNATTYIQKHNGISLQYETSLIERWRLLDFKQEVILLTVCLLIESSNSKGRMTCGLKAK